MDGWNLVPKFEFKAYAADGRIVEGRTDCDSQLDLLDELSSKRLVPFYSREIKQSTDSIWTRDLFGSASVSLTDLDRFTREAAILLSASIPLDEALQILAEDASRGQVGALAKGIRDAVVAGKTISEALSSTDRKFPAHYIGVVAAGEQAGSLSEAFSYLSKHLTKQVALRRQLSSALTYPAILMAVALIAVGIIVGILVPQLSPVFESTGRPMPLALGLTNGAIAAFWQHWHAVALMWLLISLAGYWAWSRSSVRASLDRLVLRLPLVGPIVSSWESARFARTVGTLQASGAPLIEALSATIGLSRNSAVNMALREVIDAVREGSGLAGQLKLVELFPPFSVRLIELGERTGNLDQMLTHAAEMLETDFLRRIDRIMSLITPALTLLIGVGVGGLILSVMSAILSVNEVAVQ